MKIKNKTTKILFLILCLGLFFGVQHSTAHAALEYHLLESFPGFFAAKSTMTDLPKMILAIYKFGIWTVGIAGLFMLVVGGFMYMASAGNTSTASSARGIIADALLGIVGALSAYLIIYVINPDLTVMKIGFTAVDIVELKKGAEIEAPVSRAITGAVTTDIVYSNGYPIPRSFDVSLKEIAAAGIRNRVESGIRTPARQAEIVAEYCKGNPLVCSPKVCLSTTRCPHTAGVAVDVWALNANGGQALSQAQCQANLGACFNDQYQKALIAAMRAKGFCVLSFEPWHFEKPAMSTACS